MAYVSRSRQLRPGGCHRTASEPPGDREVLMTTPMISHTDFAASEQAGQILRFTQNREASIAPALFIDNLDHLQALGQEAKLTLAVAVLRRGMNSGRGKEDRAENFGNIFPFLPENIT